MKASERRFACFSMLRRVFSVNKTRQCYSSFVAKRVLGLLLPIEGSQKNNTILSSRALATMTTPTANATLSHQSKGTVTGNANESTVSKPCRYGNNCRRKETCRFTHPPPGSAAAATTGTERQKYQNKSGKSSKPCRYGIQCKLVHCRFSHPTGWNPFSNSNSNSNSNTRSSSYNKTYQKNTRSTESELTPGFYCGPLRPADAKGYKAAGILLLRQKQECPVTTTNYFEATSPSTETSSARSNSSSRTNVQVLLCAENRKKKKNKGPRNPADDNTMEVNLLGGKIEPVDGHDARVTASREFWEETGGMASLFECQRLVGIHSNPVAASSESEHTILQQQQDGQSNVTTIWYGPGKYALYVMQDDNQQQQWDDMPLRYWETVQSGGPLPDGAEADHLVWVDWDLIVRECQPRSRSNHKQESPPITFQVPPTDETTSPDDSSPLGTAMSGSMTLQFTYFTTSIFCQKEIQNGVESAIRSINRNTTGASMQADLQVASELLANIRIEEPNANS